jgi:hypothetical protein
MTKKSRGGVSQKELKSMNYSHAIETVKPDVAQGRQTRRGTSKHLPSPRANSPPCPTAATQSSKPKARPSTTPATPVILSQVTTAPPRHNPSVTRVTPIITRSSRNTTTDHHDQHEKDDAGVTT